MCSSCLDSLQPDFENSDDICTYWQKVSEVPDGMGGRKYESVSYVAKAALTICIVMLYLNVVSLSIIPCWVRRSWHLLRTLL